MEDTGDNQATENRGEHFRHLIQAYFWAPVLLGAIVIISVAWIWERTAPENAQNFFDNLVDVDLEQGHIDTALPIPRGDLIIKQSFVSNHNGLREIELTLARYGEAADDVGGRLYLRLVDETGAVLAEQILDTPALSHNQVLRLPFPSQSNSAGRKYELQISGSQENSVSIWGYSLDVYDRGAVSLTQDLANREPVITTAQDLRFVTRYRLTGLGALKALAETFYFEGLLFVLALFVFPLPGCLLLLIFQFHWVASIQKQESGLSDAWPWDPAVWWGAAVTLGVAAWSLLWLWLTLLGGRWTTWLLWLVVAAGWLSAIWLWWRDRQKRWHRVHQAEDFNSLSAHPGLTLPWGKDHLLLLLIILAGLAVRLLAVRDISFPPWVDSSRHGLVTAVMAASGQTITNYLPFLPVDRFPYHFGFHTLSATLSLMSD